VRQGEEDGVEREIGSGTATREIIWARALLCLICVLFAIFAMALSGGRI